MSASSRTHDPPPVAMQEPVVDRVGAPSGLVRAIVDLEDDRWSSGWTRSRQKSGGPGPLIGGVAEDVGDLRADVELRRGRRPGTRGTPRPGCARSGCDSAPRPARRSPRPASALGDVEHHALPVTAATAVVVVHDHRLVVEPHHTAVGWRSSGTPACTARRSRSCGCSPSMTAFAVVRDAGDLSQKPGSRPIGSPGSPRIASICGLRYEITVAGS